MREIRSRTDEILEHDALRSDVVELIEQQAADHESIADNARKILATVDDLRPHVAEVVLDLARQHGVGLISAALRETGWQDFDDWCCILIETVRRDPDYWRRVEEARARKANCCNRRAGFSLIKTTK